MRSFFLFAVLFVGCSGGDFAVSNDGTGDGATSDSTIDTGSGGDDTGGSTDSGGTETGATDSGGTTDGSVLDGGGPDIGTIDANICPRPPSTKSTFDFSALGCDGLGTAYAAALDKAKVCGCDEDCSTTLPDNFCNNCKSFVSPGNDAYREAQAIFEEFTKRTMSGKCPPLACPDFVCPDPTFGGCHGSGAGTTRTCRKAP